MVKVDKNIELSPMKVNMLWEQLKTDMTEETFKHAIARILRSNTYNNITTADFYQESEDMPKLYDRKWYLKQILESSAYAEQIDIFEDANRVSYYCWTTKQNDRRIGNLKPIFLNGKFVIQTVQAS